MENCTITVKGGKIIIEIPDPKATGSRSSTGKSMVIASTRGAVPVDVPNRPGVKVALNVTAPVG